MAKENWSDMLPVSVGRRDISIALGSLILSVSGTTILKRDIVNTMRHLGFIREPSLELAIAESRMEWQGEETRSVMITNSGGVDIDELAMKIGLPVKIIDSTVREISNTPPSPEIDINIDSRGIAIVRMDNLPAENEPNVFDRIQIDFTVDPDETVSHKNALCNLSNTGLYTSYRYSFEVHGQEFKRVHAPSSARFECQY